MAKPKKKYAEFVKYLQRKADQYKVKLHLSGFEILIAEEPDQTKDPATLSVSSIYPYKECMIYWSTHALELYGDERNRLDRYILHELAHMLLRDFLNVAEDRYASPKMVNDVHEATTDALANIFYELI
jgi:hypothetical protein